MRKRVFAYYIIKIIRRNAVKTVNNLVKCIVENRKSCVRKKLFSQKVIKIKLNFTYLT